jgi:hypothetical protein
VDLQTQEEASGDQEVIRADHIALLHSYATLLPGSHHDSFSRREAGGSCDRLRRKVGIDSRVRGDRRTHKNKTVPTRVISVVTWELLGCHLICCWSLCFDFSLGEVWNFREF